MVPPPSLLQLGLAADCTKRRKTQREERMVDISTYEAWGGERSNDSKKRVDIFSNSETLIDEAMGKVNLLKVCVYMYRTRMLWVWGL